MFFSKALPSLVDRVAVSSITRLLILFDQTVPLGFKIFSAYDWALDLWSEELSSTELCKSYFYFFGGLIYYPSFYLTEEIQIPY